MCKVAEKQKISAEIVSDRNRPAFIRYIPPVGMYKSASKRVADEDGPDRGIGGIGGKMEHFFCTDV